MKAHNRYLYHYLAITFGVWWTIAAVYLLFSTELSAMFGPLTLLGPMMIVVFYLPSIAGLVVYYQYGGKSAVKALFGKLIPTRQDLFWLPILLLVAVMFSASMHFCAMWLGYAVPKITDSAATMLKVTMLNFIKEVGLLGGIFGWIGFLLPFWQAKLKSNVLASVVTGATFGLWVLPGYIIPSFGTTSSYPLYVIQLVAFILFQSYIFNATRGNLLMYLLSFWLAATGAQIQLYYFNAPIQVLEIIFFLSAAWVMHFIFSRKASRTQLSTFPDYIWRK